MITPSKALFYVMAVLIVVSLVQTYWKTMVQRDFIVINDLQAEEEHGGESI